MQQYKEPAFERIRRIRLVRQKYLKDTRCSEDQFSRLLEIEPGHLKKIESQKMDISLSVFQSCSKIFGVSVDHLVSDKIMWEDQFNEPILFRVQIGSVIHAIRTELAIKKGWRDYSLKSVAEKLGISSMELKRIEEMNKSKHFTDPRFLKKVSEILNLSATYIEDLLETSFPRGDKRKEAVSKVSDRVHSIKEDGKIVIILKVDPSKESLEQIQERIKLDVDQLHSKSSLNQ